MPKLTGFRARIAPRTAPGPASRVIGAALLLALPAAVGGCDAIYDDTKGWANRLEASILKAAHDLEKDPDSQEPEHYTPEEVEPPRPPRMAQSATAAPSSEPAMAMAPAPAPAPVIEKAPAVPPQAIASRKAMLPPSPEADGQADGLVGDAATALLKPKESPEKRGPEKQEQEKTAPEKTAAGKAEGEKSAAAMTEKKAAKAETKSTTPPLPKPKPAHQVAEAAAPESAKPPKSAKTAKSTKPAKSAKPAESAKTATAGNGVSMVLHLSSLRSEEAAKREWRDLKQSFPEPLGGLEAEIRRTELGEKGTFYRILAGPLPTRSAAREACATMKSRNIRQYCRVLPSQPEAKSPS